MKNKLLAAIKIIVKPKNVLLLQIDEKVYRAEVKKKLNPTGVFDQKLKMLLYQHLQRHHPLDKILIVVKVSVDQTQKRETQKVPMMNNRMGFFLIIKE
jgi:hypothetical protein